MKINKFLKKYFTNKYHGIYRHSKKLFVFDIILLILAVSLLGSTVFWFFWQPSIASEIEISLAYSSENIISGEEIELFLDYKNNSKLDLNETVLSLHFPDGFLLNKEKNPQISGTNSLALGQICPGGNGKLTIYGQIVGNVTENDKILAILTYKIGKSAKIDQKEELFFINYAGSQLKAELDMEKDVFPDKELPFSLKLANLSENDIEGITVNLPAFFNISQKIPQIISGNEEITIQGTVKIPKTLGQFPFSYSITREFNSKRFIQQTENLHFNVLPPDISIKLTPQTIYSYLESGDTLKIQVDFENLSGNMLENQVLVLQDINNTLDLENTAKLNNIEQNGQELILDKNFRSIFQNGSSDRSDSFVLALKLKENAGLLSPALYLKSNFSANISDSDLKFTTFEDELKLSISSVLQTEAKARYYTKSGDQIGRGPLPPQIGQATKYWIYLDIQNGANELINFEVTAIPGKNTAFTGKQSIDYGREITFGDIALWQKDIISASTSFGLYFEVENIPEKNDLGKNLELIKEIKITATDKITGKKYEIELGTINNELQKDDEGIEFGSEVVE